MKAHTRNKFRRRMQQAGAMVSVAGLSGGAVSAQDKPSTPAQTANVPVVGKVVTPDGKPVKEVAVFWIERDSEGETTRRFTVDTDAQGNFRFAEPPPKPGEQRYVMLLAQAPGWGLSFQAIPYGADASKPVTITLLPSTTLRVGFTDPTGKPLPNLPVRVKSLLYGESFNYLSIPASMHGRWEQKTDSKGECLFPGLPQGAKVHLEMQTEKFAALNYENDVTLGKTADTQTARIRLVPGGTIEGRVTDADGKPTAGIRVGAQAVGIGAGGGGAVTDAQGNYRITGLLSGAYNVAVHLKGEQEKNVTARALEKTDVKPGAVLTGQNITLIRGSQITGKVTDKSTGKPIVGVRVGIQGPAHPRSGAAIQAAITGQDGVYQARVPAGTQYVYVQGMPSNKYERLKEGVNVTVGEDASVSQGFALSPSLAPILKPVHGHVVSVDGKPIAGAKIAVVPVTGNVFYSTTVVSDANGAFSVEMTTASARLRARFGNMATESTTLAQSGETVTLKLEPHVLLTLGGQVADDKGKPLAGAKVTLYEWWLDMGYGNVTTTTDAQGHFVFPDLYPDARYSVSAEAPGYGNQGSQTTQYKPGEKADVGRLRLPRAASFVAGRVVDENGDPIAKQRVCLDGRTSQYHETITDAQGRFRFEGVVNEALTLGLIYDKGFSPPKKVMAGDKDVILVHKSAGAPQSG